MIRYDFTVQFAGSVDENTEDEQETLEDIRNLVIESFRPDTRAGVRVGFSSITVSERPEIFSLATGENKRVKE
jgi:hypothetical protein